jgi:small-conductance mechanosensitive channel
MSIQDEAVLQYLRPLATFCLVLLVLLLVRYLALKWLFKHSRGEESAGFAVLRALQLPSLLWSFAAAVKFGLDMSIFPHKYVAPASKAIIAFLIVSISMVAASAAVAALTATGRRRRVALALSGLASTLIRVVVFTFGLLALLRLYSVNITPMLATLGVGGLAVALALQDSLANFFAGIHILIEEPISVGQTIRLSTGEEGVVTDIGWRTTRVRSGSRNIFVIPNTKITSGILVNYNLPDIQLVVEVAVIVGFDADLEKVRKIILEETKDCAGVLAAPEPQVFFNPGALSTHLQFTVNFTIPDFNQKGAVQSEVRLRIYSRLKAVGVALPAPWVEAKVATPD